MSLDVHYHNENLLSIRDAGNDLNLADKKWDYIFDYCILFEEAYFLGSRAYDFDNNLATCIASHLNDIQASSSDYFDVLARINVVSLLLSRNGSSRLWEYYEFPSFIFCKSKSSTGEFNRLFVKQASYTEIASSIEDILILYRNIERDVLWLQKGNKSSFPFS